MTKTSTLTALSTPTFKATDAARSTTSQHLIDTTAPQSQNLKSSSKQDDSCMGNLGFLGDGAFPLKNSPTIKTNSPETSRPNSASSVNSNGSGKFHGFS